MDYEMKDNTILIVIIVVMIMRNSVFINLIYPFYATTTCKYLVSIYKCANTRYGSGEKGRSFIRNVFFNLLRDLQGSIVNWMLLDGKGIPSLSKLNQQVTFIIFVTFIFQKVPKEAFRRYRYFWVCFDLEYRLRQGFELVQLMNKIHDPKKLNGDILTGFFLIWF